MAVLTVRTVTAAGLEDTALSACAAGGDTFINDGKVFLKVVNGAVASQDVIFVLPGTCDQGESHTVTVAVGAGKTKYIGFLDPKLYNQATNYVNITYSAVVTLTIAAYHIA
jgi:hypothetical protein